MESEVYITLVTRITDGQPALRIMGSNEANAATAFRHLENLMVQIEGRFFEVQTLNVCLDGIGGQVALLKYDNGANELTGFSPKLQWPKGPGPKQRNATVDQSMLAGLMGDDRLILIERQIARSLNGIRRQKKVFSMNVHLGLFVLTKGIPGGMRAFSHNDFLRMMENTDGGIEAFVTRASGQERGSFDIRPRLTSAGNFLTPVGEASGDLAKVRPVYRGKFILENSLEPGRNYLLQVEFRIDEEGDVTQLPAKWSEFEAGKILPTQFLDVNLVDLADGRACHFGLEGTIPIVEALVPVHLQAFSDSITLYRHVAEVLRHDTPFLYWLPYRNMNIKQVTLERVFTYQIRNTGFLVEASHTTVGGLGWWWSVDVRHSDWPMHLVQLEKLKPGREANWSDAVKLFFPDDGMTCYTTLVDLVSEGGSGPSAGLRLFVNKLICLSNILARRSVTVDGQPQFSTYPPVGLLDL
ncbi:hypothetical protein AOQ84DRAFT_1940 [Glonium stellatum]|uniref:DUF7905 domain-containing protein n=1 Tax=Glonium stellatum TaxID=574774 RepID=A0A8E2EN01_9PEZI|nr:hypothetical protein AOQ84DRAFT_1940 [Glonium stellatum]